VVVVVTGKERRRLGRAALALIAVAIAVLIASGVGQGGTTSRDSASSARKLTLMLDFVPSPYHVGIYQAVKAGYYKKNNIDLRIVQLLGQIVLEHNDFRAFGVGKILAIAGIELRDRVFALLHHLVDDGEHVGVRHFLALVDFALLDRGHQQPDRREPSGILRAKRGLHVVRDA